MKSLSIIKRLSSLVIPPTAIGAAAAALIFAASASGADYTWDPNGATHSEGAGTWDTTSAKWNDGTLDSQVWSSGANAIFGWGSGASGTPGKVKLNTTVTIGNLTFAQVNTGGYEISQNSGALNFNGGTLTVDAPGATNTKVAFVMGTGLDFTKAGSGTLVLSSCTWSGGSGNMHITGGVVKPKSNPNQAPSGTLILENGCTYDLNGQNLAVGALSGAGAVDNSSSSSCTLTLSAASGTATFPGSITSSGGTSKLAVTVSGAGTQVLSGNSYYTGATTVSGGALLVNGSLSATAVTVSSGATFGGTGATGGAVTYSAGALAVFTVNSPMTIFGKLVANNNVVHLNLPAGLTGGPFTLATYNATGSSGSFASAPAIDTGSVAPGNVAVITTGGGAVVLNITPCTTAGISSGPGPSTTAFDGAPLTLTVTATGSNPTFQWQVRTNGGATWNNVTSGTGGNSASYTTANLSPADNLSQYQCAVNVSCDGSSVTNTPTTLTVVEPGPYWFRSVASGNWSSPSTWEMSANGTSFSAATATPSYLNSNILVRAGHTVTVSVDVQVDQVRVDSGGQIAVNNGATFTVADGPGTDLDVFGVLNSAGTVAGAGSIVFENGGRFQLQAGALPTATWSDGSTCEIDGGTSGKPPVGLSQSFFNFFWNWPGSGQCNLSNALTTVRGTLEMNGASGAVNSVRFLASGTCNLFVGQDVLLDSGYITGSGGSATGTTLNLSVGGNFVINSGATFDSRNSGTNSMVNISFTNAAITQNFTNAGGIGHSGDGGGCPINWIVNNGCTLSLSGGSITLGTANNATADSVTVNGTLIFGTSQVTGPGSFTAAPTSTLIGNGTSELTLGLAAMTYGGTLNLPGLPTFAGPLSVKLFDAITYNPSSFSAIVPPVPPGTGLVWDTSQLTVSGNLVASVPGANPSPTITNAVITHDGLVLSGRNGPANQAYYVVVSADPSAARATWTTNASSSFDGGGNFSITNAVGPAKQFYMIKYPAQ